MIACNYSFGYECPDGRKLRRLESRRERFEANPTFECNLCKDTKHYSMQAFACDRAHIDCDYIICYQCCRMNLK